MGNQSILKWHNVRLLFRPSCHAVYLVLFVIIYRMWICNSVYGLISVEIKPKMRHGLATLNSNNFGVYGQKHKVWVPVFLVRTSGTF